jgi:transcriptional regulator with XRE-family HTH domain
MKYKRVHIGSIIKEEVKRQNKSFASFAQEIGIQKQNVERKVFSKQGLDTDYLMLISEKLNCNFFRYYYPEIENNQNKLPNEIKATISLEFGETKQNKTFCFLVGTNEMKY